MIQQNLKANWKKESYTQENEPDVVKETGELGRMKKQDQRKNTRNVQNQAWIYVECMCAYELSTGSSACLLKVWQSIGHAWRPDSGTSEDFRDASNHSTFNCQGLRRLSLKNLSCRSLQSWQIHSN